MISPPFDVAAHTEAAKDAPCWDAARALNPKYPFLKDIDKMEQRLRTDQPEFF